MSVFSSPRTRGIAFTLVSALALAACAGGADRVADSAAAGAPSAAPAVTPTGKVITVQLATDAKGNYFEPNQIEAQRGDVIRFTLKTGVHNVHFLPDSNPGRKNLPPASEFLQLPGQTWDLTVAFEPGSYYFQCDPHALLGMVGRLQVK